MFYECPDKFYEIVAKQHNAILLESSKWDALNHCSYLFTNPIEILETHQLEEIPAIFDRIEQCLATGQYYIAGYVNYECGYHFQSIPSSTVHFNEPLLWFGIYSRPAIFYHQTGLIENFPYDQSNSSSEILPYLDHELSKCEFMINYENYQQILNQIKNHLLEGDIYQINFTDKYVFEYCGSIISLYKKLKHHQRVCYGALINLGKSYILSFSPELFFRRQDDLIVTQPMKGTTFRQHTFQEDEKQLQWLQNDPKSRAENVMIVDLLRNDLGQICQFNSVKVQDLFTVERYPTLLQMHSTVLGELTENITYYDIFKALFPCGSITGAPKIKAMEIIADLEQKSRGIYTGAIGFFAPQQKACFNVAIRTLHLRNDPDLFNIGKGEMGIGSGIVWDSLSSTEYQETILKATFLHAHVEPFQIIETLLYEQQRYPYLSLHLERLIESASYFNFPLDLKHVQEQLHKKALELTLPQRYKVRLLLNHLGQISLESSLLPEKSIEPIRAIFASISTLRKNTFLYHKTTNRRVYERWFKMAQHKGFDEIIFFNELQEVTEGAISNIIIKRNDLYLTPPLKCGLLNGVFRRHLFQTLPNLQEQILLKKDLLEADEVLLCNAIHGLRSTKIIDQYMPPLTKNQKDLPPAMFFYTPAKVNLFLNIIQKRYDGYHDLMMDLLPISLHDIIEIIPNHSNNVTIESNLPELETEDNLIIKAVHLLEEKAERLFGVHIKLKKNIPTGAGLGGGSSNAGATLSVMYHMYHLDFNFEDLYELARKLGADVPFFIAPYPAHARGIGDIFTPLPPFSPLNLVLIYPNFPISTAEAYKDCYISGRNDRLTKYNHAELKTVTTQMNDFWPALSKKYPVLIEAEQALYAVGAIGVNLTGSGSCLVGIFSNPYQRKEAEEQLQKFTQWKCFSCRTIRNINDLKTSAVF